MRSSYFETPELLFEEVVIQDLLSKESEASVILGLVAFRLHEKRANNSCANTA